MTPRPVFVVRLQAEPHVINPVLALRTALKRLLRGYGLRCLAVEQDPPILGHPKIDDDR
jgi:hypothetical protein